jgi:hypothetical protein
MKKETLSVPERRKMYESRKQLLAKYNECIREFNQNKNIKDAAAVLDKIVTEIRDEGLGVLLMFAGPTLEAFIENCYKQHEVKDIAADFSKHITALYALGY